MIQAIQLKNFRNILGSTISFSPNMNVFVGDNGQGKSNLLEALCVLTTGQSFRFIDNENLILKGTQEALLKAKVVHRFLDFDLEALILKSKKNHLLNGKKTNITTLSRQFPIVIFSPESLSAIKEGADQRRQLVDDLIISLSPRNAELIGSFRKTLRTRNKVLKNYLAGTALKSETVSLLESLNPTFLRLASDLTYERLKALVSIHSDFNNAMRHISRNQNVDISVEYVISGKNALAYSLFDIEFALKTRLQELYDAELSSGASLVGPQKHDLNFLYNQNDSRFYCSQGQQRALILAFKMAQIVYHRRIHETYPSLMLDDVLSELDAEKKDSLIKFLSEINTQIFMTTTDFTLPNSLKSEDCAVIKVREGQIGI